MTSPIALLTQYDNAENLRRTLCISNLRSVALIKFHNNPSDFAPADVYVVFQTENDVTDVYEYDTTQSSDAEDKYEALIAWLYE